MIRALIIASALLLTSCKGVDKLAHKFLYPFSSADARSKVEAPPEGLREITIENIHGWVHVEEGSKYTIVYLHGNGENIRDIYDYGLVAALAHMGANVVVVDYPGLGKSKGEPSEESLARAGVIAVEYARTKFSESKIILWGRSLGAAVAMQVMKRLDQKPDKLILTSPWLSFREAAIEKTRLAKMLSKDFLEAHGYDSKLVAHFITTPTLIHHGDKDDLIPFEHGEKLFEAFPEGVATFKKIKGAGHNDVFTKDLFQSVRDFIE